MPCSKIAMTVSSVMLFLAVPLTAAATDLRGRVEGLNRFTQTPFPVRGAQVELVDGHGQRVVAASYAGADGMYYFSNISPGNYLLRVNGSYFPVTVQAAARQDVPPVRLAF